MLVTEFFEVTTTGAVTREEFWETGLDLIRCGVAVVVDEVDQFDVVVFPARLRLVEVGGGFTGSLVVVTIGEFPGGSAGTLFCHVASLEKRQLTLTLAF